jgi:parallel beta-helix repeat protein
MKNEKLRNGMVGIGLIFIGLIMITNFIEFKHPIINEQKLQDPIFNVSNEDQILDEKDKEQIMKAPIAANIHDPIDIKGNAELASFCPEGSGTSNDPYIIEGYIIDASTAHGIEIDNTDVHLIIRDCIIENGSFIDDNYYFGIFIWCCSNVKIINNTVSNNNNEGIRTYSSSYMTISGNNCSNNGITQTVGFITNDGILLESSDHNMVLNNTCLNNFNDGIGLQRSNYNTVVGNNCSFNNKDGIEVESSNYTTISENYIVKNLEDQADSFDSNNNQWFNNSNSIGNYWGDYEARYPEATNNGVIWDTPYEISGSGVFDPYPLVIDTPPTWDDIPSNRHLLNGESLHYDVGASDEFGIDSYWLNDTTYFQIDSDGIISNTTNLDVGTYGLEIYVNDTTGHEIVGKIIIYVLDNFPIADFSANATSIYEGEWIQFTDETHHGFLPYTYEWDFGDGSVNNTQQNPIYQFDTNGTFWVTLTVNDVTGNSSSTALQIIVLDPISDDNDLFNFIDGYNGLIMFSLISIIGVLWVSSRNCRNMKH